MPINEVFQRPTVKQVIFQIIYPNLFFLEGKIGELQLKIMEKFPESALIFRRQIVFADLGPSAKIEETIDKNQVEQGNKKIWQFNSPEGYRLSVMTDSLDITDLRINNRNNFCFVIACGYETLRQPEAA